MVFIEINSKLLEMIAFPFTYTLHCVVWRSMLGLDDVNEQRPVANVLEK